MRVKNGSQGADEIRGEEWLRVRRTSKKVRMLPGDMEKLEGRNWRGWVNEAHRVTKPLEGPLNKGRDTVGPVCI